MSKEKRTYDGETIYRSLEFNRAGLDLEARTVEVAFSSEEPVERYFGIEILDHGKKSVDLDRLNSGGAVLVDHGGDQVGAIVKGTARIDSDRRGRAVLRLSRSQRGQDILNDLEDEIRTNISVGYQILKHERTEGKGGEAPTIRATSWRPFEISFVGIPADTSVGVGRSYDDSPSKTKQEKDMSKDNNNPAAQPAEEGARAAEPAPATPTPAPAVPAPEPVDVNAIRTAEIKRQNEIMQICEHFEGFEEAARKAITEGTPVADFHKQVLADIGKRNKEIQAEHQHEELGHLDLSKNDRNQFSLFRLMAAMDPKASPAIKEAGAYELDVTNAAGQAAVRQLGNEFTLRGQFIPSEVIVPNHVYQRAMRVQRDLSAGTATDGAELVATNLLAGSFIETLRNNMVVMQAGATLLPGLVGDVAIPRQTSGASSGWIATEGGNAAQSDPQFDQVTMSPKDLAVYTEVTRRLILQSTPAVEGLVRQDLAIAQALGIDLAALYGSAASGQPRGIKNTSGIGSVTFGAAAPTYAETVEMIKEVMTDNALVGNLCYIIDPEGWEDSMTTEKATNTAQFINNMGRINGYEAKVSTQVTAEDWFFGNWADLLIGEWGGLDLVVDQYSNSLSGTIRYVVFKTVDIAVRHAESFCEGSD